MKIETLEKLIKKTDIPYGDLLKRAEKNLDINYFKNGVVKVGDPISKKVMTLYFENDGIYKNNLKNGLIGTAYNY